MGSLFAGYDGNITGEAPVSLDQFVLESGKRAGGVAVLTYERRWTEAMLNVTGMGSAYLYPDVADGVRDGYGATLTFSAPLGNRTRVSGTQSAGYSPFYGLGVFPVLPGSELTPLPTVPGLNYSVYASEAYTFGSSVEIAHDLSARDGIQAYGSYSRVNRQDETDALADFGDYFVGARYFHRFSRGVGVRLGYAYRAGRYGQFEADTRPARTHDLDVGLDFSRSFSLSRRTTFTFATGSTITKSETVREDPVSEPPAEDGNTDFFVGVSAQLVHEIRRTWSARAAYVRNVNYVDGFRDPFFSDSAGVGVGGTLGRRVDVNLEGSYSKGAVGIGIPDSGYDIYSINAGMRVALTRYLAIFGGANFYHYDFEERVELPEGFARLLDRKGARMGLTLWLPII
jgi:hypothetical protein